jgi:hypothetical protein
VNRQWRSNLADKHAEPPVDRVKELADEGRLFGQIATELDLDRNTVTSAWWYWHKVRERPVPDGRGRRKTLPGKSVAPGGQRPR